MVDLRKVVAAGFLLIGIGLLVPALDVLGAVGSVLAGLGGLALLVRREP